MGEMTRRKPGPGWKHVAGAVWDHISGIRLHMMGLVRLPGGQYVSANTVAEQQGVCKALRIAGGNPRRGLMIWALQKLEAT